MQRIGYEKDGKGYGWVMKRTGKGQANDVIGFPMQQIQES